MPKSLPCLAMLVMLGPVLGRPAAAQDAPFADSLLVTLPMPKADAADAVVAAFTRAGLTVTNTMA